MAANREIAVRADMSDQLVHFTSGNDLEHAFANLLSIVDQRTIRGSGVRIREGYRCVCFTEAPLASMPNRLANPRTYSRYSPFGIVFDKAWIFAQGGRPVIYQSEAEFESLTLHHRWRHMRYEPNAGVDFTWEREWRVRTDALALHPSYCGIVLPEGDWERRLRDAHAEQQAWTAYEYAQVLETDLAAQYEERFGWRIYSMGQPERRQADL